MGEVGPPRGWVRSIHFLYVVVFWARQQASSVLCTVVWVLVLLEALSQIKCS